jgi:hypothetical protein
VPWQARDRAIADWPEGRGSGSAKGYLVGPEKHFNHFLRNVIGMILAVLDCRQNLPAHSKSLQSASMKPTSSDTTQTSFLLPDLEKQLDPRSLLYRLAQAIDWKGFEKTFGLVFS